MIPPQCPRNATGFSGFWGVPSVVQLQKLPAYSTSGYQFESGQRQATFRFDALSLLAETLTHSLGGRGKVPSEEARFIIPPQCPRNATGFSGFWGVPSVVQLQKLPAPPPL